MTDLGRILPEPACFDVHIPVIVVGGGACGLTAALAAADAGADVVVLEGEARCEGSSAMSLGAVCAAGTAAQAAHGIDDDADTFAADILAKTGGTAEPKLTRIAARRSGPALDWLDRMGIPFELDTEWRPAFGHSRRRMHAVPGRSGRDMMARFVAACEGRDIPILTSANVAALFAGSDGTVTGALVERPDGSRESIGCDALILATCGFGGNPAWVAKHIPTMAHARYFGWEANRGSGIAWGRALGAATGDMSAYQGLGLLAEPQGIDVNPKLLLAGGVQINQHGHRFNNEVVDVSGQGARVMAQPGGTAWVVYDETIHQTYAHLDAYRQLIDLGAVRQGGDADAIADVIGIPTDALRATLTEVEAAQSQGVPDRFGRQFDLPPLVSPFYALKVTGALFHTQGGLLVDEEARVLRPGGEPLPNLFAGGGAACSIGGEGGSGYLPGAGLCMALTLGWLAGTAAASQVAARSFTPP